MPIWRDFMHRRNISNHRGRQRRFSPRSYLLRPSDFYARRVWRRLAKSSSCCRKCAITTCFCNCGRHSANTGTSATIRGRGLFIGMEFTRTAKTPFAASNQIYAKVQRAAFADRINGLPRLGEYAPTCKNGDHILIAPPFIFTPKNTEELIAQTTPQH